MRRLRHRAWLNLGQEMRPLQHALLWARMPGAALERGRPRPALQIIKKAGGAEQYNANKKYAEAVAVAAEACADDTKGQTCYICTQALHWKTKEGLVRGCACRGTAGFAHVSCLAEQAKILVAEAEENNLGDKACFARWIGGTRVACASKTTTASCGARARVGVLEDVRGAAGEGRGSERGDEHAWERFIRCKTPRGRVVREKRPSWL